ncbi:hypothetical protein [Pseudomonas sp. NFX1]|uniref:hypothetical protein n=1 Tax=Pseudomonas sp. NFX1 TaxID=2201355 RepID=UPI003DA6FF61
MTPSTLPAGGRATEGGMAFQAGVAVWFAAHLLAKLPVGGRFGLDVAAYPVTLQLETGEGLDDIFVTLSNGSHIAVQCKTRPSLSASQSSDLGETLIQAVQFAAATPSTSSPFDMNRSAAVMAVASDAPATLNALDDVCRMFATSDDWLAVHARVSKSHRHAMKILRDHVTAGYAAVGLAAPTERQVAHLARSFHIERFATIQGEADWREAANILGARLYGGEEYGAAPLICLVDIVRRLIKSGAPADREGLLSQLRAAGHNDQASPQFNEDIAALQRKTLAELKRLQIHMQLPIGGGLPLERTCMPALRAAAEAGSFLVIGEPGAGKTGVLVALAEERLSDEQTTIFLSADDLASVTSEVSLRTTLGLQHSLIEVLAAWPGLSRGLLVIDALDASRGGCSEAVFATLITDLQARLDDRWSVVASIRSFDLRHGKRFRQAMPGALLDTSYVDSNASGVRHFLIPALTDEEVMFIGKKEGRLGELLGMAPTSVQVLLRNMFNLSIAAQLIDGGTAAANIATVTTQSELIDRYEDERLPTADLQLTVAKAVEVMVERRRLLVRKVDIASPGLEAVLAAGVLVANGDRVGFLHHVLFDHAAGRFWLDWNDPTRLITQMSGANHLGLLLGPSLRFAIERVWRDDALGRPRSWSLTLDWIATAGIDPVVSSAALRSTTERVADTGDIGYLCSMILQPSQVSRVGPLLSKIARYAGLGLTDKVIPSDSIATAWASVAAAAASMQRNEYADGTRILLLTLFEKANFANRDFQQSFGKAARAFLSLTWAGDRRLASFSSNAIRFVAKSYGSDPDASRQLLQRAFDEPHFSEHAHEEAPWLAEGTKHIAPVDPPFVIYVFAILFGRAAPSEGDSWIGGAPSRIMALRSNRRQDYEHARWSLLHMLPEFLDVSPVEATRAVNAAVLGIARRERTREEDRPVYVAQGCAHAMRIMEDGLSYSEWRGSQRSAGSGGREVLESFVDFLSACQPDVFRLVVEDLKRTQVVSASLWARVLGIAADRNGVADDLLWPVVSTPEVGNVSDLIRDWAAYLSVAYRTTSLENRKTFEHRLIELALSEDPVQAARTSRCAARLLSVLDEDLVATAEFLDFKRLLEADGQLSGNRPLISISTGWQSTATITQDILRSYGVDVDNACDQAVLDAEQALRTLLSDHVENSTCESVRLIWSQVMAAAEVIEVSCSSAAQATLKAARGCISRALKRIAGEAHFDPAKAGHPTVAQLVGSLDGLACRPALGMQLQEDLDSDFQGDWGMRSNVAAGFLKLAHRFGDADVTLVDRVEKLLDDPEPEVRQEISRSLNLLWEVDHERMWSMMTKVAQLESDVRSMAFFVDGPLSRAATADAERVEPLLVTIIERLPPKREGDTDHLRHFHEALGALVAGLYVNHGKVVYLAYLKGWLRQVTDSYELLWAVVSMLREPLFMSYRAAASKDDQALQSRAHELLLLIVNATADEMPVALSICNASAKGSPDFVVSERAYLSCVQLIEHCVNQFYFGSGASSLGNVESHVILDSTRKSTFLRDYQSTLSAIAQSSGPAAIHHLLQLYEFLMDGDPATTFDQVFALLVGPAARELYHFESLGLDAVVRIVRRFLADNRELFESPSRRSDLIEILDLFSEAGWLEALKLLYELPDLMR